MIKQNSQENKAYHIMLAEEVAKFRNDPLGFVYFAYPWGEGELQDKQLNNWQIEVLSYIGECLQNGINLIRIAVASGHGVGKSCRDLSALPEVLPKL